MRAWAILTITAAAVLPARADEDIAAVLQRSQQQRLAQFQPAPDGPRAEALRRSFHRLQQTLGGLDAAELRVVRGPVLAETLLGRVVVANEALADSPEGERLFVLAHELGHVQAGHWQQMGRVYERWIPGPVTPERTDPVAAALGREASLLARQQELQADVYALLALHRCERSLQDAIDAFVRQGPMGGSPTHPGTRARVALLRAAEARQAAGASGADAE